MNSKVLVTGGLRRETELYDPASGTFSDTGLMTEVRSGFFQTMLDDGRVLVAGGQKVKGSRFKYFASTEIYNPDNGVWSRTDSMTLARRNFDGAVFFAQHVFAVGGIGEESFTDWLDSIEEYDPFSETWTLLPRNGLATPRGGHTVTPLADGITLLISGGSNASGLLPSAELLIKAR